MPRLSFLSLVLFFLIASCKPKYETLKADIDSLLVKEQGKFAVAFKDVTTGETILVNEKEIFHAASTMKTPVMIEVYKQAKKGSLSLSDSLLVTNKFTSIVDTTTYSLSISDDSEAELYSKIGKKVTIAQLVEPMIISSSNLATNILMDKVGNGVTQTMRDLGANDIKVLRGVEDSKAFQAGLSNVVTAYDLMIIYESLAEGKAVDEMSSKAMIEILLKQKFNDVIPAKLPKDVKVAHKTGWIKGVRHDSGIVYLPNGKYYVLVLLSKEVSDDKKAIELLSNISRKIYDFEYLTHK